MILIDNRQDIIEITEELIKLIKDIVKYTLKQEMFYWDYEISIIFIDNENIKKINNEYRNINEETDVLSFPMLEYPKGKTYKDVYVDFEFDDSYFNENKIVLGDIALSFERAKEQSIEFGHSLLREISYLVVHSVLHLLGYDHMENEDKLKMRKREEEILKSFNLAR